MASVANLLQILKSAAKLLPENLSLLKPNPEPTQLSLKFGTARVKELFLWRTSLQQQEKRTGPRGCQRVELSQAGTHTPPLELGQHAVSFYPR